MNDRADSPTRPAAGDGVVDGVLPPGADLAPAGLGSADSAAPSKSPLRELLTIAIPTVATMTSYTLMTFVDKLMSSRLGPDPIYVGAQGNGGLSSWVPISVVSGLLMIINTYVSQNLGAGKPERGPAYAWNGAWLAAAAFVLFMIPFGFALPQIYAAMRDASLPPDELARIVLRDQLAADYARILIFTSIFTMLRMAFSQFFYGMHKPGVVLVAGVVANLVNFVCNSILIYGPERPAGWGDGVLNAWFGFTASVANTLGIPRLGITGAALGTVIATIAELVVLLAVFLGPKMHARFKTRAGWRPSLACLRDIVKLGAPGGLMFGNEMICWGLFMVYFVGHFGPEHSTAGWIAHQYMSLSFMPAVGISVAVTAVVGKCMGMGRPDLAAHRAWLGVRIAMVYMGACGICFVLFRDDLIRLFMDKGTPPDQAARLVALGGKFLILTAVFQLFDALAMVLFGALRGAGDTIVPGIVTVALSWLVIVGGGLAAITFLPTLESTGPWGAAALYIIVLSLFGLGRFLSGRWRRIRLVKPDAPAHA